MVGPLAHAGPTPRVASATNPWQRPTMNPDEMAE
jgi:hypothetical protein